MKNGAKSKIFKSYSMLIAGSTILVMLFLFVFVALSNNSKALFHQQEILTGDLAELNAGFEKLGLIASQVNSGSELLNMFVPLADDGDAGNYFDDNLLDSIRGGSFLETINSLSSSLERICVYNAHGDFVSAGRMYVDGDAEARALAGAATGQAAAALAQSGAGFALVGPHADWWSDGGERLLSYILPLSSVYNERGYGYVEVQQSFERVLEADFMNRADGTYYLLADAAGAAAQGAADDVAAVLQKLSDADWNGSDIVHLSVRIGGARADVLCAGVGGAGWTLMRILPFGTLIKPYIGGYASILAGTLVLLLLLLLIAFRMAGRVARPLHDFAEAINGVTLDNMTMPALPPGSDRTEEIDMLDRSFRRMLQKLNSSIGLEMKAYLNALQSQMDPHFLYNMLTVMAETADVDGSPHTVEMCQRLSRMLRYMANYEGNSVTLGDELGYLRTYLELMHDRYDSWFTYEIEELPEMLDIPVPRMILQPLAENCFQHGFKKLRPPWRVHVTMAREGRRWTVSVSDNGGGITEEEIRAIFKRVNDFSVDVATNYQQLRIGGLGMVNTVLRMRLTEKEMPVFRIENLPEGGTRVTIGGTL